MVLVNDGTSVVAEDIEKRKWLKANNYRYIVFSYKEGPEHKDVICREKWPTFGNAGCPFSVDMIKV